MGTRITPYIYYGRKRVNIEEKSCVFFHESVFLIIHLLHRPFLSFSPHGPWRARPAATSFNTQIEVTFQDLVRASFPDVRGIAVVCVSLAHGALRFDCPDKFSLDILYGTP